MDKKHGRLSRPDHQRVKKPRFIRRLEEEDDEREKYLGQPDKNDSGK